MNKVQIAYKAVVLGTTCRRIAPFPVGVVFESQHLPADGRCFLADNSVGYDSVTPHKAKPIGTARFAQCRGAIVSDSKTRATVNRCVDREYGS